MAEYRSNFSVDNGTITFWRGDFDRPIYTSGLSGCGIGDA